MKPDGRGQSARRDVVGSTERREEIVQRVFVRYVDDGQASAPLVFFAVKNVVVPDADVE